MSNKVLDNFPLWDIDNRILNFRSFYPSDKNQVREIGLEGVFTGIQMPEERTFNSDKNEFNVRATIRCYIDKSNITNLERLELRCKNIPKNRFFEIYNSNIDEEEAISKLLNLETEIESREIDCNSSQYEQNYCIWVVLNDIFPELVNNLVFSDNTDDIKSLVQKEKLIIWEWWHDKTWKT